MRIDCPLCGSRDRREFYYQGSAVMLARPNPDAGEAEWQDYLHLRENVAGQVEELWQHDAGCSAWLVVTRDTVSHVMTSVTLAADAKRAVGAAS